MTLAAGCSVPSLDLASKKCSSAADCNGQTCTSAGACVATLPEGGLQDVGPGVDSTVPVDATSPVDAGPADALAPVNLCLTIPHFLGTQQVDGDNSDFGSVPTEPYPWGTLQPSNNFVGPGVHLDVTAQVGWSSTGVHLYFRVHYEMDGSVVVPGPTDFLWFGDAVELFLKGDSNLTGNFDPTADLGALHLVASPDPTNPPRTQAFFSDSDSQAPTVPSGDVAVQRNPDGYSLEFFVPWTYLLAPGESVPEAGSAIGFDLGVDYRNRDAAATPGDQPSYQLLLLQGPVTGTTCPGGQGLPPCDDRTWCTPMLAH